MSGPGETEEARRSGETDGAAAAEDPRPRRLEAVRRELAPAGLDGLLQVHPPNVRYLTGFAGSSGLLVVSRDGPTLLVTDFRYEEQAREGVPPGVEVRIARDGLFATLAAALEADPAPRRLGFRADHLTVRDRREAGERCGRVSWEDAPPIVERLRARKDAVELALLGRAAEIAADGFETALGRVEEGMTEREVAAELEYALRRAGSGPLPFEPIVASGPRSSLPHAEPGQRRLREGDLLLFDFGATAGGYGSDLTRTVVLGEPRPWQREIHDAVREAQAAALAGVAAGVPARDVDRAARRVLEEAGLQERFGHSTGHGIGLEVHEAPRLSRRSEDRLEAGHVVTVEPGVYLPGRGGVRIEDDVAVEETGGRLLTSFSRALREL